MYDGYMNEPANALTRVTANFTPRAVVALNDASTITGDNKTDTLNKSVQIYAFLMKVTGEGKDVIIEDPKARTRERLQFL